MLKPNLKVFKTFRMGMSYATRQLKDIDISAGQDILESLGGVESARSLYSTADQVYTRAARPSGGSLHRFREPDRLAEVRAAED